MRNKSLTCLSIFILLIIMCAGCGAIENNESTPSVSIPVQSASPEMEVIPESFKPYETDISTTPTLAPTPTPTPVPTPTPTLRPIPTPIPTPSPTPTPISISIEGMSVEEYLATYGMEEYTSEYIHLKAVEGITYVPNYSYIGIYYNGFPCGSLDRPV